MYTIWSFFTRRSRFSIILIATILFLGITAILQIPKESNPEVNIPIAVVSTVLPGGSPEDVEKLVTNILETPLKSSLSEVSNLTSVSSESVSSITIEFNASADISKSMQDVRDTVDSFKGELPDEASDPAVIEIDFGDQPVFTATISADIPKELLFSIGEKVEDELEAVSGVASVSVGGIEKREVTLIIDRRALIQQGLSITDVTRAIASTNVALPVGNIQIEDAQFPVRLAADIKDTSEVGDIPIIGIGGAPLYVRDIARVVDARQEPTAITRTSLNNNPSISSISFDVFKNSNAKITKVSADARGRMAQLQEEGQLLEGIDLHVTFDSGEQLSDDLVTLTRSGMQTVALVTLVLLLAVGWREALIAGISIPLSFLTAFIVLEASGNTLNFISLFALILSIGIIVDSTIVIVEGINRRLSTLDATGDETVDEREFAKSEAALDVIKEFHVPLTAGTMTTVAVFAPLLLVSGIVGEFIKSIPYTIIFVLFSSLLVALGFVPMFATKLLKRGKGGHNKFVQKRNEITARVEDWYRNYLASILASREAQTTLLVTLIVLFVVSMALPVMGAVRVVFFEDSNSDFVIVEAELPTGTVLERTDLEIRKAEEILYGIPEATSFVTTVGSTSQFGDPFAGASGNSRFGNIFITLNKDRERSTTEIIDDVRNQMKVIKTSSIRVDQLSDGPPSGAPIVVTLRGEDLTDLSETAFIVEQVLTDMPGTTDVTSTAKNNSTEFVLSINRAEAVAQGVSLGVIASSLRAGLFGEEVTEIKQLGNDIEVIARLSLDEDNGENEFQTNKTTIDTLTQIEVPTSRGAMVPLSAFVTSAVKSSEAAIRHEDAKRIMTVASQLTVGSNAVESSAEFEKRMAQIQLPEGVSLSIGGETEDVDQSFADMFTALIIGLVSMFAILVLQFNSFRFAVYVLAIVPLSLIGVFTGLMLTGSPLSFPSIMGFIALSGIVVNNSIILVDTINNDRRRIGGGETLNEIVVEASASRLRPVLLTALTTVVGMIPLLSAAAIWVPLAYAIMFGLAFATIITLLLVPSIYARWPGELHQ